MKRGYVYTFVFMLIVAFSFATVLSVANQLAKPAIAANKQAAEEEALLYALDVPVVDQAYANNVKSFETADMTYYEYIDVTGEVVAYAVPYTGTGLWGPIRGFLAISPDFKTLQGLAFTEQNETPGLGGRIGELWFRDQFRGQSIVQPVAYGDGIDAITGATSSSTAVLNIVNDTVESEISDLEAIINGQ